MQQQYLGFRSPDFSDTLVVPELLSDTSQIGPLMENARENLLKPQKREDFVVVYCTFERVF